jgi:hypothetical protein
LRSACLSANPAMMASIARGAEQLPVRLAGIANSPGELEL